MTENMTDEADLRQYITLDGGSIRITAAIYEQYFAPAQSCIILIDKYIISIMPVHNAANGGYLLKQKNALGDRIVTAPCLLDFCQMADILSPSNANSCTWDSSKQALNLDFSR